MNTADVSFVIPCYNNERWIGLAIESALNQTVAPMEIIVVDDGSTDGSAGEIAKYGSKIITVRQENKGRVSARIAGIRRAGSEWIAFLDGDDTALPTRLECELNGAKANPDAVLVHGQLLVDDGTAAPEKPVLRYRHEIPSVANFHDLFRHNLVHTSSVLARARTARDAAEDWKPLEGELAEDYGLWLLLSLSGPLVHVPQPVGVYRLSGEDSLERTTRFIRGTHLARRNAIRFARCRHMKVRLPRDWRLVMWSECMDFARILYDQERYAEARQRFFESWLYRPTDGRALIYAALTCMPSGFVRWVRRMKRKRGHRCTPVMEE